MPKTTNTCKYKYMKGGKAGQICGNNCKNKFCKLHSPKTKDYKSKYYFEKRKMKRIKY